MAKERRTDLARRRHKSAGSPIMSPPMTSTLSLAVADEANRAACELDFIETLLSMQGLIPRDIDLEF